VAELQEQLQEAQQSIMARDAEVSRLGARLGAGGPDVEALSRDQRGDAYDTVILSLNKQVGDWAWFGEESERVGQISIGVCRVFCLRH
jgi:hypothetical protein